VRQGGEHWKMAKLAATQLTEHILRVLAPVGDAIRIPRVSWNSFRRSNSTVLGAVGESLKTAQVILGHSDLEQHYRNPAPDRCARTSGLEGSLELSISSVHGQKYLCLRTRLRRFFAPEILCIAALSRFHGRTPRRARCHRQPCVIACL
jgi:hypothetical protein